ncbi:MAG: deoxyguanosinetriphosphate triphosphohydrolase [Chthoniobacterales bacterium]|nr:deoxyguanosinetriphosphate triphosphohydrolase [Chthoniobacterales bacterium]
MPCTAENFPFLAQHASQSLGRLLPETPHAFRNCFQRDRDRIVHSTAFRRLDGKTQVFLNGQGDYYRTRLTHTIEVASISRTIARALGLNEDLSEAIALAHDLGHPPSGHAGERTLHELMRNHGGFDHNEQSLRVVTLLEDSYPQHPGLNLSYEVLEGLRKHHTHFHPPVGEPYSKPSLEAQLVDIADEIAYYSHDLDDGIEAGLLPLPELEKLTLWREACEQALEEIGSLVDKETILKNRKFILRCLINHQVEELLSSSKAIIKASHVHSAAEVKHFPQSLIRFSKEHQQKNKELRHFLYQHFYRHPSVATTNHEACDRISKIFSSFITEPGRYLGARFLKRIDQEGKHRVVCDYIAGMTDRYVRVYS